VALGQHVLVRPGEQVPLDGIITWGTANLSLQVGGIMHVSITHAPSGSSNDSSGGGSSSSSCFVSHGGNTSFRRVVQGRCTDMSLACLGPPVTHPSQFGCLVLMNCGWCLTQLHDSLPVSMRLLPLVVFLAWHSCAALGHALMHCVAARLNLCERSHLTQMFLYVLLCLPRPCSTSVARHSQ